MTEVPIIDQTISAVAPVLHRDTINPTIPATQDAFVNSAEAFFDKISDTTVNELNQVTTKIDATVSAINIVSNEISTAATDVEDAKQITIDAKEATIIAKNEAQSIYDNFDDRYLGTKSTPPTVDNDGDPLKQGALYCQESINPEENGLMYVYDILLGDWVNIAFIPTLLSSLTDVFFSGLANGDILKYDISIGKWKNIPADYYTKTETYTKTEVDTLHEINNKTDKATPIDTDNFLIQEIGGLFKKLSWANIKATLKTYFDTLYSKLTPTIATGTATFTATTNNINLTGIGIGVEIGDVIQISGAEDTKNNSEFTVEVITDANNIIVNQSHANKGTSKNVAARASDTGVTVKLLAKWYNASDGLGQGWVNVTPNRALNVTYPNATNRSIIIALMSTYGAANVTITTSGLSVYGWGTGSGNFNVSTGDVTIPKGESYLVVISNANIGTFMERR